MTMVKPKRFACLAAPMGENRIGMEDFAIGFFIATVWIVQKVFPDATESEEGKKP